MNLHLSISEYWDMVNLMKLGRSDEGQERKRAIDVFLLRTI